MVDQKYATAIFHAELDPLSPKMTPMVKEFRALIEARTKRPLSAAQLTLLDAVYVLAQGIGKAQSLEADKVKRALEEMKSVDTINGKGRMAREDYFGLKHVVRRPIAVSGIQNGKAWREFTNRD